MALLKDLIVTGASKFIGDAYFNTIKLGTWNGSIIAAKYGGLGVDASSGLGSSSKPIYIKSDGTAAASSLSINADIATGGTGMIAYYTSASAIGAYKNNLGSVTQGIYLEKGIPKAMTYNLSATVNSGTASNLAYYSDATTIDNVSPDDITAGKAKQLANSVYLWGNSFNGSKDTDIYGSIAFKSTTGDIFTWLDGTYQQKITLTDDSTDNTAVFTFYLSVDSGSTWKNLFTIKDNSHVVADTFEGNATSASVATLIKTITNTTDGSYYMTFVDSNNSTSIAESLYTDSGITYNPSTNELTAEIVYNEETVSSALNDLIKKVFPLECTFTTSGNGTLEVGTPVTLTISGSPKKRGASIDPSTLTWTSSTDNSTYNTTLTPTQTTTTCTYTTTAATTGTGQLRIKVTDGTTTLYSSNISYSHTYYRYYGEVSLDVLSADDITDTIINSLFKDWGVSRELSQRDISLNCNYIFLVQGSGAPVAYNNLGTLSGCITGTKTIARKNGTGNDSYSFTIVPGSSSGTISKVGFKA